MVVNSWSEFLAVAGSSSVIELGSNIDAGGATLDYFYVVGKLVGNGYTMSNFTVNNDGLQFANGLENINISKAIIKLSGRNKSLLSSRSGNCNKTKLSCYVIADNLQNFYFMSVQCQYCAFDITVDGNINTFYLPSSLRWCNMMIRGGNFTTNSTSYLSSCYYNAVCFHESNLNLPSINVYGTGNYVVFDECQGASGAYLVNYGAAGNAEITDEGFLCDNGFLPWGIPRGWSSDTSQDFAVSLEQGGINSSGEYDSNYYVRSDYLKCNYGDFVVHAPKEIQPDDEPLTNLICTYWAYDIDKKYIGNISNRRASYSDEANGFVFSISQGENRNIRLLFSKQNVRVINPTQIGAVTFTANYPATWSLDGNFLGYPYLTDAGVAPPYQEQTGASNLYLGVSNVKGLYLGVHPVKRAYRGSTLVFERG